MSSYFSFNTFRKHQKTLMVLTIGVSMFSFVICGSIQEPGNVPTILVVIAMAFLVGGAAWLLGLQSGRSSEYGLWGIALGAVGGLLIGMSHGAGAVVLTNAGDLSAMQLQELQYNRSRANQFVGEALRRTAGENPFMLQFQMQQYSFGENDDRSVVLGELLRREADNMGLEVSDEGVQAFIERMTGEKMTAKDFTEIRQRLGLSDRQLVDILRSELQAAQAYRYLFGGSMVLPPAKYWDFYRRLNVRQTLEAVILPVEEFVDESAEPADSELQELFAQYRETFPNMTAEGKFEAGRPGFRQYPRVKVGYLEAPYADVERLVAEVTDADVEAFYEENYKKLPPPDAGAAMPPGEGPVTPPALPDLKGPALTPPGEAPPADGAAKPAADPPATPAPEGAAPPAKTESPAKEGADPASPPAASEAAPDAAPDTKPEGSTDNRPRPAGAPLAAATVGQASPVAFVDETPATDAAPADSAPSSETPSSETPSAKSETPADPPAAETPAEEKSATEKPATATPDAEKPAAAPAETPKPSVAPGDTPAAPAAVPGAPAATDATAPMPADPALPEGVRPLTEDLKLEIRDRILRDRVRKKTEELIEGASQFFFTEIGYKPTLAPTEPDYMSPETVAEKLKAYAQEQGLVYGETPLMTYEQLTDSEDEPIGEALDTSTQTGTQIANLLFQSSPTDVFRASKALRLGTATLASESQFLYWKIEARADEIPQTLEEVRDDVVTAWRTLQAAPRAEARAKAVADKVRASTESMAATLAEETITGEKGDLYLEPRTVGPFSWMSRRQDRTPDFASTPAPEMTDLSRWNLDNAGDAFMETAFNDLAPGEVGVTHNADKTEYYVIKILSRTPSSEEEQEEFRKRFLFEPVFNSFLPDYQTLANQTFMELGSNWAEELWKKYDVRIVEPAPDADAPAP